MLVLSLLLSLMSLSAGPEHPDLLRYVFQVLVAFQIIGLAAIVPSLTTPAISAELETGTFESLRLTRLGGWSIFWGKFLPAFLPAILPIIALLPAYLTVCYVNHSYLSYLLYVMPIIVLTMAFSCILGLLCSTFSKNSARATVVAYIIISALMVIPMLAWWASSAGLIDNERLVGWISMPSPLVIGLSVAPVASPIGQTVAPAEALSGLRVTHEWLIAGLCVAMLLIARVRLAILLRRG
jgi:ABC-type transport system involved in multi-copper enzyme maturation permease subunit